ncbi:WaRThog (hedgehog-like family) [Caenorhabditis elegans]|uniref:WaRThog (Hedgehog-like family) n=1 Tax=Caenorhabditis elegans TaxID=6239 RepID=Q20677_CAEEL|nr:WaRThog (hedgehog-like family) [Caenorhabditis elegans]CCD66481.1 WaRThog (hedgehog-like family) [Caenorhabditis elegans]|eukprot:NP_508529.1 WaRThog (hedgehog-like family) [Caenorhabditis elegans]
MHTPIIFLLALVPVALASYCGQSAIPYTFQVLRSGYPVLGCARPKCFGWTANGTRAGETAQFYRVAGKDDGYLRRSDQFIKSPSKNPNFVPQLAICTDEYKSKTCEEGEWVGGLSPQSDPFADQLEMKCCSYQVLISAEDRGNAIVKQGQLVVGGEVLDGSRLVAFDYISNLSKSVSENGTVVYVASIKRMPCFDEEQAVENKKRENTIVEAAAVVEQPATTPTASSVVTHQPSVTVPQQGAPLNIQPYAPQQQQVQQPAQVAYPGVVNPATNYGQFSQQAYGVAQNGQYSGYPQYAQQQPQPQYYQDPFAAMLQQQHQAFQQQVYANQQQQQQQMQQQQQQQQAQPQQQQQPAQPQQQLGFAPLPQFPQPMMFQAPQVVAQPGVAAAAGVPQMPIGALPQMPVQMTSTLPPMTLPKLEDLPKLQIPSVEDVEQVIPPVQRAILTSVAKFFGVL